jgi:hypothetical protein
MRTDKSLDGGGSEVKHAKYYTVDLNIFVLVLLVQKC